MKYTAISQYQPFLFIKLATPFHFVRLSNQTFISIHLHFLLSILLQQRLVSRNLHRPLRSFHAKIFKFYLFIKQAITL